MTVALPPRRHDHRRTPHRTAQGPVAASARGVPEVMALTRRIKNALDPAGILNPGVRTNH